MKTRSDSGFGLSSNPGSTSENNPQIGTTASAEHSKQAPIISFENVSKSFDGTEVLKNFNLDIPPDEIFVMVGPSGSGKTTTLRMMNELIEPDGGVIKYRGTSLKDYTLQEVRWDMGYVLQKIALFPNMTVLQNLELIPEMKHLKKVETRTRISKLMDKAGMPLDEFGGRYPRELSGGEAQRVGIIRALAADPPVVLMDEPFSALDPLSRTQLQDLVLDIQSELHKTIIFVTHDMREAVKMGDHIAVIRNGVLRQLGTPEELKNSPADNFVHKFFMGVGGEDPLSGTLMDVIEAGAASESARHSGAASAVVKSATATITSVVHRLEAGHDVLAEVNGTYYRIDAAVIIKYLASKSQEVSDDSGNEE